MRQLQATKINEGGFLVVQIFSTISIFRRNKAKKWRHAIPAALLSGRLVPSENSVPLDTSDTSDTLELSNAAELQATTTVTANS